MTKSDVASPQKQNELLRLLLHSEHIYMAFNICIPRFQAAINSVEVSSFSNYAPDIYLQTVNFKQTCFMYFTVCANLRPSNITIKFIAFMYACNAFVLLIGRANR